MRYSFHPEALRELLSITQYYARANLKLAKEFLDEVDRCIEFILHSPSACTPYGVRARKCPMRRFPFSIIYKFGEGEITIIAIMHFRRDPDCWKDREP